MSTKGKNIVIVGAGFGGLQTALNLEKRFKFYKDVSITLVDKRAYHLFTPNLYEIAASEEELTSLEQVKRSITLPLKEILKNKKINFIEALVEMVEPEMKQIKLAGKNISYDFLILALGSQSDFFGIEGADKYSLTLKSFSDALRIRNQIEFVISAQKYTTIKKTVRIVFAGGGYTGLELATELKGLVDFLAWKYQFPREKVEIEIIEGSSKLIPGFDDRLSEDSYQRLQDLGIRVRLSSRIVKVDGHFVELNSGDKIAYDALIWTAGVKASPMVCSIKINLDNKDRFCVNEYFQVENHTNIFAIGDLASITGKNGKPVPSTAQDAWAEARYLAYALPYIMENKRPPKKFANKEHGFIVNLGGKWAIVDYGPIYLKGYLGFVINQLAHLRYYFSVLGIWKGLSWLLFQEKIYSRND